MIAPSLASGALALVMVTSAPTAHAALIWDLDMPSNNPADGYTLKQILDEGGLVVGDKIFDDFSLIESGNSGALNFNSVTISGVGGGMSYGITVNGPWITPNGGSVNATLGFSVTVDPSFPDFYIESVGLDVINSDVRGNSSISISENIFDGPPPTATEIGDLAYFETATDLVEDGEVVLDSLQQQIYVVKDITLESIPKGHAEMEGFTQMFHQVPEPGSLVLLMAGATCTLRRRR